MSTTSTENTCPTPLQDVSDEQLFAEVRHRIGEIVQHLDGLQLVRAYEALAAIAAD